jgi:hypothetical protein
MRLDIVQADISMQVGLLDFSLLFKLLFVMILRAVHRFNKECYVTSSSSNILLDLLPQFLVIKEFVPS